MSHVTINIDYFLYEASLKALEGEVAERIKNGKWTKPTLPDGDEIWTRVGLAADIRGAYYAQNSSRLEMLLTVLERHEGAE